MKNTLKTLGIICIIAAAFLIASCGPFEPETPSFTVTFDSGDGGSPATQTQTIEQDSGDLVRPPTTTPTKTVLTDPGLYKNWPATGYELDGWYNGANKWDFDNSSTITSDLRLEAKWKIPDGVAVDLSDAAGNDDVTKAFNKVNAIAAAGDKYTLYINTKTAPAAALTLTKENANLTILGKNNNSSEIKSPPLTGVFLFIGTGTDPRSGSAPTPNTTTNVTLTLKNIAVVGSGTPTANSLIRVINGATLTLDENAYIADHISSSGAASAGASEGGGDTGNGAAICVLNGSTLNIKQGAIVEKNISRPPSFQTNMNRVGGIYVIGNPSAGSSTAPGAFNISTVNIEGGNISGNKCELDGNTADIYITELVNLNLQGNVEIGELCINSDDSRYPTFTIEGKVTNKIKKLNLRSTGTSGNTAPQLLTNVKNVWTAANAKVFTGTADYDISEDDVKQFELWEFTARSSLRGANKDPNKQETWDNYIPNGYVIDLMPKAGNTPNYGKLAVKPATP